MSFADSSELENIESTDLVSHLEVRKLAFTTLGRLASTAMTIPTEKNGVPPPAFALASAVPVLRLHAASFIGTAAPRRSRHARTAMCALPPPDGRVASKPVWQCMSQCGACCKLDDFEGDVLRDMLKSEADVVEYLGMIGDNGWCTWFDSHSRRCSRYDSRPRFCRATPQVFTELYGVPADDFDEFAVSCCEFHITNTFGDDSHESMRYESFTKGATLACGQTQQCAGELD